MLGPEVDKVVHAAGAGVHRVVHEHVDAAPFARAPVPLRFERDGRPSEVHGDRERPPRRTLRSRRRCAEAAGDAPPARRRAPPRARCALATATRSRPSASRMAVALPMPRLAPVTRAPWAPPGCVVSTPWTSDDQPFTIDVPRGRARRPARAARAHPLPRPDRRRGLGLRHRRSPTCASCATTGATTTTGAAQEARLNALAAVHAPRSTGSRSTSSTPARRARRAPAADHPRLARLGRRVPRRHRPLLTDPARTAATRPTRSTSSCRRCPGYGFSGPTREPGWDIAPDRRGASPS